MCVFLIIVNRCEPERRISLSFSMFRWSHLRNSRKSHVATLHLATVFQRSGVLDRVAVETRILSHRRTEAQRGVPFSWLPGASFVQNLIMRRCAWGGRSVRTPHQQASCQVARLLAPGRCEHSPGEAWPSSHGASGDSCTDGEIGTLETWAKCNVPIYMQRQLHEKQQIGTLDWKEK